MSVLKKNIKLHPFTAPSADNITPAAEREPRTAGPKSNGAGGKEGGENNKTIIFQNGDLEVKITVPLDFALDRLTTMQKTAILELFNNAATETEKFFGDEEDEDDESEADE